MNYLWIYRDANASLLTGVVSEENYAKGQRRTMISLNICFSSWLFELLGTTISLLSPTLQSLGIRYYYYFDAIIMFLVIPFCHLMNDEATKGVVLQRGWYQGLRHMAGFENQIGVQDAPNNQNNWYDVNIFLFRNTHYHSIYSVGCDENQLFHGINVKFIIIVTSHCLFH